MYSTPPYFINGQHRITVNVIGAGGSGSLIVTKLARFSKALNHLDHPGLYVKLIDYDVVEPMNVGRQMFTPFDEGKYKADTIISKINMAFGMDWDCFNGKYNESHADANITIIAVDNVNARIQITNNFYKKTKPGYVRDTRKKYLLMDCGNARDFGQVIISDIEKTMKNIFQLFPDIEEQDTVEVQGEGCSYLEKLDEQDLFINDWISLYALTILKDIFFKKQIDYQGFFFNTSDYETQKLKI